MAPADSSNSCSGGSGRRRRPGRRSKRRGNQPKWQHQQPEEEEAVTDSEELPFTTLDQYPIIEQCRSWPRHLRIPPEMMEKCRMTIEMAKEEVGRKYAVAHKKVEASTNNTAC